MYFLLACTCMSINCVYFSSYFFFCFFFPFFFFLYLISDERSASCHSNVHTDRTMSFDLYRGMYANRDDIFLFFFFLNVNHGCILLFCFSSLMFHLYHVSSDPLTVNITVRLKSIGFSRLSPLTKKKQVISFSSTCLPFYDILFGRNKIEYLTFEVI